MIIKINLKYLFIFFGLFAGLRIDQKAINQNTVYTDLKLFYIEENDFCMFSDSNYFYSPVYGGGKVKKIDKNIGLYNITSQNDTIKLRLERNGVFSSAFLDREGKLLIQKGRQWIQVPKYLFKRMADVSELNIYIDEKSIGTYGDPLIISFLSGNHLFRARKNYLLKKGRKIEQLSCLNKKINKVAIALELENYFLNVGTENGKQKFSCGNAKIEDLMNN